MLITTDFNKARRNTSNRAEAWRQITAQEPVLASSYSVSEQEQAIDDVIIDWCSDYANELERGLNPS